MNGNNGTRRRYKFSDKSQSAGGIFSTIFAILAAAAFAAAIGISFQNRGEGGIGIGVLGILTLFFSAYGLYMGIRSFREEEIFFLFSWVGSIANAVFLLGMLMLILLGL